jgi:hypothetical protein
MRHLVSRKCVAAGILGLSLAILPMADVASAQAPGGGGAGGTGRAGAGADTQRDDGFDYGWLGLLGLLGLAGLLRRDSHRRMGDATGR